MAAVVAGLLLASWAGEAANAAAAAPTGRAPAPLSADRSPVHIHSSYGSGSFGRWRVDGFGLPAYRYAIDEQAAPQASQPELSGRADPSDAWHQLGNDHVVADAFNHGYTQLWSQDRRYEWTNLYQPGSDHFSGGYGYLRVGGRTISTLYPDRPAGARTLREFGLGYFRKRTEAAGVSVDEHVYAPFGDDPLLIHDVTIRNHGSSDRKLSWFEYWDVNPYGQATKANIGLAAPVYDPSSRTLSVAQLPSPDDSRPLSIFAAALRGPLQGFDTSAASFFGGGGRANPAAVAADHLGNTIAQPAPGGAPGDTLFAFRAPLTLRPGQSITLRYAYGAAHPGQIAGLVDRYRGAGDPLSDSERSWARWVPQVSFGNRYAWLSRELQWDAYTVRSGAAYEDCQGRHTISQGGYYQYEFGFQGAFRDPLQHMLPMVYSDPALARDVLVYSAQEQPEGGGQIPYAMLELCKRFDLGTSDDLDLWLLWAASEYGLASRDLGFFDQPVRYADGGSGTLWDHLKLAYRHQEQQRLADGNYAAGTNGDWSDLSTAFLQMTESSLVTAQLAYVYPQLAKLAEARGDSGFAAQLRASGAADLAATRAQWTGRGWYARGYAGTRQIGRGAIFGEPQPWAILAGAPSPAQAATLVANIRRFLTGVGAPPQVHGPAKIGSSQSPAANDPEVTEHSTPVITGTGDNSAVFVGGAWYSVNGWLAWALGELQGVVPGAADYAFDELRRNTLAAHAEAYPDHWNGIISVDDVCRAFYSSHSEVCGNGLTANYAGQIMHQPAWSLFDAIKLAGIEPTAAGYRIQPHLPLRSFSLRLPEVGVAYEHRTARGYITTQQAASLRMEVAAPSGRSFAVYVDGRPVPFSRQGNLIEFTLPTAAGRPADWAVAARPR
jgi:hypothetical protein